MNNLQFIATYINNNPATATYTDIRLSLMLWKGWTVHQALDTGNRGWNTCYFCRGFKRQYHGRLWIKVDPSDNRSVYRLTEEGKKYVVNNDAA